MGPKRPRPHPSTCCLLSKRPNEAQPQPIDKAWGKRGECGEREEVMQHWWPNSKPFGVLCEGYLRLRTSTMLLLANLPTGNIHVRGPLARIQFGRTNWPFGQSRWPNRAYSGPNSTKMVHFWGEAMFIFDEHAFGYAVLSLNHVVVSFLSKCSPSFLIHICMLGHTRKYIPHAACLNWNLCKVRFFFETGEYNPI